MARQCPHAVPIDLVVAGGCREAEVDEPEVGPREPSALILMESGKTHHNARGYQGCSSRQY